MDERGHKADNVKLFFPEETHCQPALLPTLQDVQGASVQEKKKKTHPDPGVVLHVYSFEHGMFWKTCPFQSSYL